MYIEVELYDPNKGKCATITLLSLHTSDNDMLTVPTYKDKASPIELLICSTGNLLATKSVGNYRLLNLCNTFFFI